MTPTPAITAVADVATRRWGVAAAVILVAGAMPMTSAEACSQWRADGEWRIRQQNNVEVELRDLKQQGDLLTGYGWFYGRVVDPSQKDVPGSTGYRYYSGQVDMIVDGNRIEFQIFWMPGMVGVYRGTIDGRGQASGEHWDRDRRDERIGWRASVPFRCRTTANP